MANFRISWEIDLDAENMLIAAFEALNIIRDEDCEALQFYVQNAKTNDIFSVDASNCRVLPIGNYLPIIKPLFATKVYYTVRKELNDDENGLSGIKSIYLYSIQNNELINIGDFECLNEENTEGRIELFLNDHNIELVIL